MVCDVTIASTVVSLMMNGICCYYQNEQQEHMRREMQTEYQHILYQQQYGSAVVSPKCSQNGNVNCGSPEMTPNRTSVEEYNRRRKLMLDKANALNNSLSPLDTEEGATACSSCPTLITPEQKNNHIRATQDWGIRHRSHNSRVAREVSVGSLSGHLNHENLAVSLHPNGTGEAEGIEIELIETSSCHDDAPFENIPL